jgi:hypothetical protein
MARIDLDDLPPRIAQILQQLSADEELLLVRGASVVARMRVDEASTAAEPPELPPEEGMREILEQFNAMIHDEF